MKRRPTPRMIVAGGAAVLLAAVAAACGPSAGLGGQSPRPTSDDDRSQIIVRGGSAVFDNGTGSKANPWAPGNPNNPKDKKKWKSGQNNGASVSAYAVTVQQPMKADGTPSTPCPTLPLVGQVVTIEYTKTPSATEQFTFSIVLSDNNGGNPKNEPLLSSSTDLAQSSSTPSQLVYDPQTGWLSKVTIGGAMPTDPSESCSFNDPNTTSTAKAIILIQPLK